MNVKKKLWTTEWKGHHGVGWGVEGDQSGVTALPGRKPYWGLDQGGVAERER